MNGQYQIDWDCEKYCGKKDGVQPAGYHWADCPRNPWNIKRYGDPDRTNRQDNEDEQGNPINI